jgi:hypothetical protein
MANLELIPELSYLAAAPTRSAELPAIVHRNDLAPTAAIDRRQSARKMSGRAQTISGRTRNGRTE